MEINKVIPKRNQTMPPIQWKRQNTEELILLYKQHGCLWNKAHPHFSLKEKRQDSFVSIANRMSKSMNGLNWRDIREKLQSIRSQYRKEIRAISASKRNNSYNIREPRLWFFNLIKFLRPSVDLDMKHCQKTEVTSDEADDDSTLQSLVERKPMTSHINIESIIEQSSENGDMDDDPISLPGTSYTTPRNSYHKKDKSQDDFHVALKDLKNAVEVTPKRRFEWLGEQIVCTLNEMKNEHVIDESVEILQQVITKLKKRDTNYNPENQQQPPKTDIIIIT